MIKKKVYSLRPGEARGSGPGNGSDHGGHSDCRDSLIVVDGNCGSRGIHESTYYGDLVDLRRRRAGSWGAGGGSRGHGVVSFFNFSP